jgi:hypothetical protein
MRGSTVVYGALIAAAVGVVACVRTVLVPGLGMRAEGAMLALAGLATAAVGLRWPAFQCRVQAATTRLDEFTPVWQFNEVHSARVAAPPARVFDAVMQVRADEIFFFRTLTWIRRGGRRLPPGILNAGSAAPLLEVAVRGGFVVLADDAPREIVIGTIVAAPAGPRPQLTVALFNSPPPGFALGAVNFVVSPDGARGSLVTTETRVFASSPAARRRFAAYWRVIYPGSALIRRMWLRAIVRRAR